MVHWPELRKQLSLQSYVANTTIVKAYLDQQKKRVETAGAVPLAISSWKPQMVLRSCTTFSIGQVRVVRSFCDRCLNHTLLINPIDTGTRQAAEDLDSFRQAIGADKLSFYGVSYRTQIFATYATSSPKGQTNLLLILICQQCQIYSRWAKSLHWVTIGDNLIASILALFVAVLLILDNASRQYIYIYI